MIKPLLPLPLVLATGLLLSPACDGDDGSTPPCQGAQCDDPMDGGGDGDGDGDGDADAGDGDGDGDIGDAGGGDGDGDAGSGDAGGDAGPPPANNCDTPPDVSGLGAESVATGLNGLVYAAQPKGSSDWYLVEQGGVIKVQPAGTTTTSVFLDLSAEAAVSGDGNERGLLSLAFPPDYASSGFLYVMVTPTSGGSAGHDMVYRFTRSASDPRKADPATRQTIVDVPASASNHNGGTVAFGPDGMLYVGVGDGGGGCNSDKPGTPQDVNSLYGKILKLDLSRPAPYGAADNPFGSMGGDARVLHYGLRNPFRFGFDRLTGDLYIGDVGQGINEEISFAKAGSKGLNFGWGAFEGKDDTDAFSNAQWCPPGGGPHHDLRAGSTHTPPIVNMFRGSNCGSMPNPYYCDYQSVVGGVVYRGNAIPKLKGAYLFGDYYGDRMGVLYQCASETSDVAILRKRPGSGEASLPAAAAIDQLTAIVEGSDNELYLVVNRNKLLKLTPATP